MSDNVIAYVAPPELAAVAPANNGSGAEAAELDRWISLEALLHPSFRVYFLLCVCKLSSS